MTKRSTAFQQYEDLCRRLEKLAENPTEDFVYEIAAAFIDCGLTVVERDDLRRYKQYEKILQRISCIHVSKKTPKQLADEVLPEALQCREV